MILVGLHLLVLGSGVASDWRCDVIEFTKASIMTA